MKQDRRLGCLDIKKGILTPMMKAMQKALKMVWKKESVEVGEELSSSKSNVHVDMLLLFQSIEANSLLNIEFQMKRSVAVPVAMHIFQESTF